MRDRSGGDGLSADTDARTDAALPSRMPLKRFILERRADLTYEIYRTGARFLGALEPRIGRSIGAVLGLVGMISPRRFAEVDANFQHVTAGESPRIRHALVRRAFVSYGTYWADGARLVWEVERDIARAFTVEGYEHIERAVAAGRGLLLALPHLGCWEFGARFLASRGIRLLTVGEVLEPPELYAWFVSVRRTIGVDVLPLDASSTPELLRRLRGGGHVALLADRDIRGDGIGVKLFDAVTRLPAGPALLALRTGAALVPCAIYHRHDGTHHAVVLPPISTNRQGRLRENVTVVSQDLAVALEALICRAPEQWHMFQPNWPRRTPPDRKAVEDGWSDQRSNST